jgi:predicted DNA-binding transcriptional regulator YafY
MYHPTTRLLTILELLQAHGRLGSADLARRLEVDRRSIRRYVAMLQELGIPIEGTRGPHGGYRLRQGFTLPPLLFTEDEAVALALGLLGLPQLGLGLAPPAVSGALAKVRRVLPQEARVRVGAIEENVALEPSGLGTPAPGEFVALCSKAARAGQRVWLRYRAERGEESERIIDPYGVARWSRYWYVVGYCHLRVGLRSFRLDRVLAVEVCPDTFAPPPDFDSLAFVVRSIATMPGRWAVEVLLDLPLEEARRRVPAAYGTLDGIPDGTLFRCRHDDLDGLARYLVGLGCPLVVRQPAELRAALRRLAATIAAAADAA